MSDDDYFALCHSIKSVLAARNEGIWEVSMGAGAIAACMKGMGAGSLTATFRKETVIVVRHDYEPVHIMARCERDVDARPHVRTIRLLLAAFEPVVASAPSTLPPVLVEKTFSRWTRCIGLVFGERFAIRMVTAVIGGKDTSKFSAEDLEKARMRLIGKTGGCLTLTMPQASTIERK